MFLYIFKTHPGLIFTHGITVVIAKTIAHAQQLVNDFTLGWTCQPFLSEIPPKKLTLDYDKQFVVLVEKFPVNTADANGRVVYCGWEGSRVIR